MLNQKSAYKSQIKPDKTADTTARQR